MNVVIAQAHMTLSKKGPILFGLYKIVLRGLQVLQQGRSPGIRVFDFPNNPILRRGARHYLDVRIENLLEEWLRLSPNSLFISIRDHRWHLDGA